MSPVDPKRDFEMLSRAGEAVYREDTALQLRAMPWSELPALVQLHYRTLAKRAIDVATDEVTTA